jgi:predicted glycosyltransferase
MFYLCAILLSEHLFKSVGLVAFVLFTLTPSMPLKFLFYLGHPAHYHNLKHSVGILTAKGHQVKIVARGKDVLFDLTDRENWDVIKLPERKPKGKLGLVANIAARELTMLRIVRAFKPNLLAGTDLVIAHIGKLTGIPSVIINEDDSAAIPLMAKYGFPYATAILAPNCCDQSPANHKKIGYEGYHELAYLHPNLFQSSRSDLPLALNQIDKYFILRFASLHAHHDAGRKGIDDDLAMKLIETLSPYGRVFITSERPFAERLEPYRLQVHPTEMHHVLAHASLYIGDSQTMAAEAAVLGVPSIRFNDFVGELSYLEELEHKYQLTKGIKTNQAGQLISQARDWASDPDIILRWQKRRAEMLANTIEVTPFWIETFETLAR